MKNVILLDLDGVLIITPSWKQDLIHIDGYSDFNEKLLENFNTLIKNVTAEIWLTSSRRNNKTLSEFNEIFKNRKVVKKLEGFILQSTGGKEKLAEINAFLDHEPVKNFLIIDDDNSLQNLEARRKQYWVKTSSLIGFDSERLIDAFSKLKNWT